jgi:uroporphyrinogen-III synthase
LTPLAGRAIVVTRPERQAAGLAALIESAGGRALRFPVIAIELLRSAELDAVLDRLASCDIAVFISRNAVEQGLARVRERHGWPPGVRAAAIGAGTRRALEAEGFAGVIAPEGPADSEALLAEPALGAVAGKRVVIFRGAGGRETLAETLRSRGAVVDYAECYRRVAPATDLRPLVEDWSRGAVHAVAVSSGEGLANLAGLLGESGRRLLCATPLFVPHARVAEQARSLGIAEVVVCGAADEEVLAALVAYFGRPS